MGEGDDKTHSKSTQRHVGSNQEDLKLQQSEGRLQEETGSVLSSKTQAGCPAHPTAALWPLAPPHGPYLPSIPCPPTKKGGWWCLKKLAALCPPSSGAQVVAMPSSSAASALHCPFHSSSSETSQSKSKVGVLCKAVAQVMSFLVGSKPARVLAIVQQLSRCGVRTLWVPQGCGMGRTLGWVSPCTRATA